MLLDHIEETKPHLEKLIQERKWKELASTLQDWPDPEIADLLMEMTKADRVLLYRSLPKGRAAQIFTHFDYEHQTDFIKELTDDDTQHLLAHLSPDDRTALLEELPSEVLQATFKLLSPEDLKEARELLGYPEDSIGRLMTPDFISVKAEWTIREAIEHMRKVGKDRETFNLVYVTDQEGKLQDSLRLRRFIMADPEAKVESIMDHKFVSLSAFEDREHAVDMIKRYDLFALPVVDSRGVLQGIVTVDDLFDVAEEETTEDFHKSAAVAPLDMPYSLASPAFLFRKRIGWLTVLLFVNLISAVVIGAYEDNLAIFTVLATFMPLVIASGGNAGAQSATLMIRAIATGDLLLNRWFRAFSKEIVVGLALAFAMGFLSYFLGFYRGGNEIGMVIGISMVAIILVANLIGVLLPFILCRLNMDPAVASSPLITSLMDAIGLLIYFGVAAVILDFV
ncbi:MAG: magnesium transporter [Opitutales bacterium]|nr:magnesium transporter [Opitutales bacterium]